MIRSALAIAATAAAVLIGSTGAAHASGHHPSMPSCGGGYIGGALIAPTSYRSAHWDIDAGTLAISAPRSWSFVRTPAGEGRFHDPDGHDLLSLAPVTSSATAAELMAARVHALAGTSGLHVVGEQSTKATSLGQRWTTLTYTWTNMGEPRWVTVRWISLGTSSSAPADLVLTVSGRRLDVPGLKSVLARVAPTVALAG